MGKAAESSSVFYEAFIIKDDESEGNWLSSCGMYLDSAFREKATRIEVSYGDTSYLLPVDAQGNATSR